MIFEGRVCLRTLLKEFAIKNHIDLQELVYGYSKVSSKDIHPTNTQFDKSHPLFGKVCVFTGKLEKLTRREAMQMVADVGGICADSITKLTNYLILGNFDYCASVKGGKSGKQQKAERYLLDGKDIKILSESVFYDIMEDEK